MCRLRRRHQGAGDKTVRKNLELSRRIATGERHEDDVVARLRKWRPIPRAVKCNEDTAAISRRERLPVVKRQIVWRPVRGETGDRLLFVGTGADRHSTVTPVLRREHKLLL